MDGIVANLNKSKSLVYTRSKGIQGLVEPFQKTKTAAATVVSGAAAEASAAEKETRSNDD